MAELTVIDRGNHCEIHQGDAIAADYVASKRLANLFAAAPELLDALRYMLENAEAEGWSELMTEDARTAIAKAEGRE